MKISHTFIRITQLTGCIVGLGFTTFGIRAIGATDSETTKMLCLLSIGLGVLLVLITVLIGMVAERIG